MKKLLIAGLGVAAIAAVVFWYLIDSQNTVLLENAIVEFKSGEYENAIPVLRSFADKGDPTAVRLTALAYAHGLGVDADDESAHTYLRMLSEEEKRSLCNDDFDELTLLELDPIREVCSQLQISEP